MPYTLAGIRTATANRLDDSSYDAASLNQFANDVNRFICNSRRWRFMEKTFTGTVTIGSPSYALPTDFQSAISLRITSPSGNAKYIPYKAFEEFDRAFPNPSATANSTPLYWYLFGTTINLYPAPDQVYTMDIRYLKQPTTLTLDADVPDIPTEFQEVVVLGTYAKALERNDQFDQAQIISAQYQQGLDAMTERLQTRQLGDATTFRNPKWSTPGSGSFSIN